MWVAVQVAVAVGSSLPALPCTAVPALLLPSIPTPPSTPLYAAGFGPVMPCVLPALQLFAAAKPQLYTALPPAPPLCTILSTCPTICKTVATAAAASLLAVALQMRLRLRVGDCYEHDDDEDDDDCV